MSSQENEARKQLRTGIRGEYEMRPLDQFTVTKTEKSEPRAYLTATEVRNSWIERAETRNKIQDAMLEPIVVACWEAIEQHLLDMQRGWTGSMLAQFLGVLGTIPPLPENGCPPEFIHALYWQKAMEELFLLKQTPS